MAQRWSSKTPLDWNDYQNPQAAYYKVSLFPDQGDAIVFDKRAEESTLEVELLPVSCGYRWSVEAYDEERTKIAESPEPFTFTVLACRDRPAGHPGPDRRRRNPWR